MLPKTSFEITNGGVYRQQIRCGKRACRCVNGTMHEAHYFISRSYGRQVKTYVPKTEVERIKELVDEARYLKWRFRKALADADAELKRLRHRLREVHTVGQMIGSTNNRPTVSPSICFVGKAAKLF